MNSRAVCRKMGTLARLATALLLPNCLQAEFIQPVAVQASNGEDVQDALINGMGFDDSTIGSPTSIHVRTDSEMWTAVGSTKADVIFDLGQTVSLTKLYLWNYNGTEPDRGMKDVQVLVSSGTDMASAAFTGIATISLAEGGETAQVFDVVGTEVRLVKLQALSNWGHGWAIGLAEARFESGTVEGRVPNVAITGLKEGDVVPFGSELTLSATVADKDGDLAKVEFFDGDTKLAEKTAAPYSTALAGLALGTHSLKVQATDKTGKAGWAVVNVLVKEVTPGTVIKIDDNADIGEEVNQIRYTGTWTLAPGNPNDPRYLNNDHYSDVSGSYFEVKFVGVKIEVYATVASHHGTARATVDGGTTYTINYKAAQRAEQVLVWSSPLLPNREHVLKVTVAGTGVVTADRFDVTQSDTPSEDRALVSEWEATLSRFQATMEDVGTSVVDPSSVKLTVDGALVTANVTKAGTNTTIVHLPALPFQPGSKHPFQVQAKDTQGHDVGITAAFDVPKPPFPLTGLGEPAGTDGHWSFRQIWDGGRADAVVTAVDLALAAAKPGFAGKRQDDQVAAINFALSTSPGVTGLFPGEEPFPAEAAGLAATDFAVATRGKVRFPRTGDWTLGVHSDDGFALRFVGVPFASVSGVGTIDEHFPEYVQVAVPTGDSNTRAVLKNLPAGDYVIELVYFQRATSAAIEVYAAEGAFIEDADSVGWALIGAADGLQLVADALPATPPVITQIKYVTGTVTIEFTTSNPSATFELRESADLTSWKKTTSAAFTSTGANSVRATVTGVTAVQTFYRVAVP